MPMVFKQIHRGRTVTKINLLAAVGMLARPAALSTAVVGHADDPIIIVRSQFLHSLMEITQRILNILEIWCKDWFISQPKEG